MKLQDYEKKHIDLLREYLPECTVLLKNEKEFRVKKPGKVALYGNGVRHTLKGGTGSGEVNSRYYMTVLDAFQRAGFRVTTWDWIQGYEKILPEAKKKFGERIRREAREKHKLSIIYGMGMVMPEPEYELPLNGEGELAIYVLSRICGEGNDRKAVAGDLLLTETEIRTILALNQQYDKFVLVLNVGGPIDLSPVLEVDNILLLSQLGVDTGNALVDILLGKANPSGKLATTWSRLEDYCTLGSFGEWQETEYREGIYVGYRYFDTVGRKALFPFGYGRSFTEFKIETLGVTLEQKMANVTVRVENIGTEAGKETVQVYVSAPQGELAQPYQSLAAYGKTKVLAPGESEELTLTVGLEELASYSEKKEAYILEEGTYLLRVGNSSVDTEAVAALELYREITVKQVKNVLGTPGFEDVVLERTEAEVPKNLPVIVINDREFETEEVNYEQEPCVEPIVENLTDEQLCYLSIGGFNPKGGLTSVIGEASATVCGAAGETSDQALNAGIPTIVMADGPAGVRIAKSYYEDDKGKHALGNQLLEGMEDIMSPALRRVLKVAAPKTKKGVKAKYQYCTAIPIGTAIAQSFNVEFASICGDIVGEEMERFGVNLWLAPALNIHRNIACGRNFEYYSEDPFVSGTMAAAVTSGVQKHPGCGVTIKHYAANNQETNRYNNNSHVSERAMREIYLKGFEICVKNAHPMSVMTSYNLLNGVHTSESRGLNEDILRSEFGFDGFIMTDWVVAMMSGGKDEAYLGPDPGLVAGAGNDLFMPGSKNDYKKLMESLGTDKISREQLELNVSRIYRVIRKLTSVERKNFDE